MNPVLLHFENSATGSSRRRWGGDRAATRWQRWLLAGALGLAGMACLVLAQRLWALQTALAQSTVALKAISSTHMTTRAADTAARPALPANERAAWGQLASALNTPWNSVFDTLESSIPTDVALISIEPDAARSTLRLEAEAATLDALLKAMRALGESEGIARVNLVKHETQEQHPARAVRLVADIQLQREKP